MANTLRVYYANQKSGWQYINWGNQIDPFPVVHLCAREAWLDETQTDPLDRIKLYKGEAGIYIKNVLPSRNSDGTLRVDFYLQIDWTEALNVCVDFTVVESAKEGWPPPPQ
ncbi:hypothetical protein [Bacillus nitratireducens]|uniref:hypothetical protein n=1 Tax=Bacillus nitratireducens TaxID=2026193 RepID=UPI0011A40527|nr:hypothetical protein [Bacillus nitratireducens]